MYETIFHSGDRKAVITVMPRPQNSWAMLKLMFPAGLELFPMNGTQSTVTPSIIQQPSSIQPILVWGLTPVTDAQLVV
jgi:hypothetical protein